MNSNFKIKKIGALALIAIIAVSMSACKPQQPTDTVTKPVQMLTVINGSLSQEVDQMIRNKSKLPDIASIIQTKIKSVSKEDADSAVLLYARYAETESQNLIGDLIYSNPEMTDKFYKIFGEELNYQWDSTKIDALQDQEMKNILKTFDNSFLKVQQTADYIGPIVNYNKLSQLTAISPELQGFYKTVDSLYLTTKSADQIKGLDYNKVAEESAAIEDVYHKTNQPLLKDFSEGILTYALNSYYIGTENSSPFDYDKKILSANFIKTTDQNIVKYANYELGKLGKLYMDLAKKSNNALTVEYADLVMNYKKFGFESKKGMTSVKHLQGTDYFESYPEFSNFDSQDIQMQINSEIVQIVEELKQHIAWGKTKNTNYNISYVVDFANEKYVSMQLYASSFNSDTSTNLYDNKTLTYDLTTGKTVTLKDLFKDDYEKNVAAIKSLVEKDIKETQKLNYNVIKPYDLLDNVVFDKNYMIVVLKKGVYSDEQQYDINSYIKYGDLLDTFDMMQYLNPTNNRSN